MEDKLIISYLKGGFGNQLQQYASALAISKRINAKLKVDLSFFESEQYKEWYKMDKINVDLDIATPLEIDRLKNKPNAPLIYKVLKKLGISSKYRKMTDVKELFGFEPDSRILNLNHSAYISGWCSSEIYVRDIKSLLQVQFKPKSILSPSAKNYLESIRKTNAVSLHIRRGDFLGLQHFFAIVPIEYYKLAVSEMTNRLEKPTFYIFSNDLLWAENNIDFIDNPIFVKVASPDNHTGNADIEEFELMKHCQHNIIANSSFSWWAAYLNNHQSKTVIAPKKWFNDKFYQSSFEKYPICPPEWKMI